MSCSRCGSNWWLYTYFPCSCPRTQRSPRLLREERERDDVGEKQKPEPKRVQRESRFRRMQEGRATLYESIERIAAAGPYHFTVASVVEDTSLDVDLILTLLGRVVDKGLLYQTHNVSPPHERWYYFNYDRIIDCSGPECGYPNMPRLVNNQHVCVKSKRDIRFLQRLHGGKRRETS